MWCGLLFLFLLSVIQSLSSNFQKNLALEDTQSQPPDKRPSEDDQRATFVGQGTENHFDELAHPGSDDSSLASRLYSNVRVLCWVMTHPGNHRAKADHVYATWGRRCNLILFMTTRFDNFLPSVPLKVEEGYPHIWLKTVAAFHYVYTYHRADADWFLKADDDTYVIPENLRLLLSKYDSSEPLYFGSRFQLNNNLFTYMNGGAGYVLSRQALDLFIENRICNFQEDVPHAGEDFEMGVCLQRLGVKFVDTRDDYGHARFFPENPEDRLFPDSDVWYRNDSYYPLDTDNQRQISDYAISFHGVTPRQMYLLDYFLYHIRPYGYLKN